MEPTSEPSSVPTTETNSGCCCCSMSCSLNIFTAVVVVVVVVVCRGEGQLVRKVSRDHLPDGSSRNVDFCLSKLCFYEE